MIGPVGYGDARFVAADQPYKYTIRFENDPNATAPAQVVVVTHEFDSDLDIRTFRLGPIGFGSFTRDISFNTAIRQVSIGIYYRHKLLHETSHKLIYTCLQEIVNLTESHGVFVRIRAGLDVTSNQAIWELTTFDSVTGKVTYLLYYAKHTERLLILVTKAHINTRDACVRIISQQFSLTVAQPGMGQLGPGPG